MSEKKFSGAPFGSQSARFDVSAVYPAYKKPGQYTQTPYCRAATSELKRRLGPGTYNDDFGDFSITTLQRKASGPGWKRAEETARLTEMPHLLYKETWDKMRFLKQNMGPGRYNLKSFVELLGSKPSSIRGACSTRDVRFKEDQKDCSPGPGSYGKGGNPYALKEERANISRGLMSSGDRKCTSSPNTGCDLGPGSYKLKSSIDETLSHVVSKRGPYDLFSGSRAQPVLYGYLATPKAGDSEPGQYKVKSFTEELENEHKKKHGTFGTMSRYPSVPAERIYYSSLTHCPRPAKSPGPGSYEAKSIFTPTRPLSVPFLCSAKRFDNKASRILFASSNQVGVGRYDLTKPAHHTISGCRSAFLSKSERSLTNSEKDKVLKERIQQKNMAPTNGKFSVVPSTA
ncbi:ciliary microtubule-associated protein 2 [Discoglossus pictus]